MKIGERALRAGLPNARLFIGLLARRPRKPKTRLRGVTTRLAIPLIDLLLDGFSLLIRDDAPGIAITTFHELGDALASHHPDAAHQDELQGS
jgi:hypothetical protein